MDLTLLRLNKITAAYVNLVYATDKYNSLLAGDLMFSTSFLLTRVPYRQHSQNSSVYLKRQTMFKPEIAWNHIRKTQYFTLQQKWELTYSKGYFIINVQRDATISSLYFILLQYPSICFRCLLHPSSGVRKTVVTTTGTSHVSRWRNRSNPLKSVHGTGSCLFHGHIK
jgi:hypothetical protein